MAIFAARKNKVMTPTELNALSERIIAGEKIDAATAIDAVNSEDKTTLYKAADRVRKACRGEHFNTCSIINARSGRCSEDCKWCSQSHAHKTGIDEYPLIEAKAAVDMAVHNAERGVERFSLVTSGRTMSDKEIDKAVTIFEEVKKKAKIGLCASMGLLTREQLEKLYKVGLRHYHCNIESAPSYFPKLCTTHTIEDKMKTIRAAREIGFGICSGGIIGMGETMEQRVEMAIYLRDEVKAVSIPVNVLVPIKGTKLEGQAPLTTEEILRTFAIFRLVNPTAEIRMAGGRTNYGEYQKEALECGIDASIVGDMLTTTWTQGIKEDMELFSQCGRDPKPNEKNF